MSSTGWVHTLAVVLVLSLGQALFAGSRGTEEEISRLLSKLRRAPKDAAVLRELGGQFALRGSEQGNPSDIVDARNYLGQAQSLDPNNVKIVAWLGIVKLVEAKIKASKTFAREGLALLDKAVTSRPDDLVIRLMRGSAGLEVPREFERLDQGVSDLEMVSKAHDANPALLKSLDLEPAEVHLKLGNGYRAKGRLSEAMVLWKRAVAESPRSKEGESASRLLRKFGDRASGPAIAPVGR